MFLYFYNRKKGLFMSEFKSLHDDMLDLNKETFNDIFKKDKIQAPLFLPGELDLMLRNEWMQLRLKGTKMSYSKFLTIRIMGASNITISRAEDRTFNYRIGAEKMVERQDNYLNERYAKKKRK